MPVVIIDIDTACQIVVGIGLGCFVLKILGWLIEQAIKSEQTKKFKRGASSPFR